MVDAVNVAAAREVIAAWPLRMETANARIISHFKRRD